MILRVVYLSTFTIEFNLSSKVNISVPRGSYDKKESKVAKWRHSPALCVCDGHPANQLRLIVYPIIYVWFFYIQGGWCRISEASTSSTVAQRIFQRYFCLWVQNMETKQLISYTMKKSLWNDVKQLSPNCRESMSWTHQQYHYQHQWNFSSRLIKKKLLRKLTYPLKKRWLED